MAQRDRIIGSTTGPGDEMLGNLDMTSIVRKEATPELSAPSALCIAVLDIPHGSPLPQREPKRPGRRAAEEQR